MVFFLFLILILFFLVAGLLFLPKSPKEPFGNCPGRVSNIVIYAYYEKNDEYKKNLEYFLQKGVFPDMHYLIVVNGKCTVSLPLPPNVRMVYRKNKGFDFGGFAHGLSLISPDHYDYFFFMNSSVRGPYLYPHEDVSSWSDKFIQLFQGDVHLVGCTINMCTIPPKKDGTAVLHHVQSYFFVLDRPALDLLQPTIFTTLTMSMKQTISEKEIGMSQRILKHGWNISCTAKKYQGYDYRQVQHNLNLSSRFHGGDPCYPDAYFGDTLDAREVVFIKTNRNLPLPEE
jgi:hypothetical protein